MANTCLLSRMGEARMRLAFAVINSWSPPGLVIRLQQGDVGVASENAAYILISNALTVGLLVRTSGRGGSYTLNAGWVHPSGRPALTVPPPASARPAAPRKPDAFALLTRIPAQRPGPLTPSLGLRGGDGVDADGELLPCIGSRITSALRGQFQSAFGALE